MIEIITKAVPGNDTIGDVRLLENMIREVNDDLAPVDTAFEKMIIVDAKGNAHEKRPLFFPNSPYKFFVVNSREKITFNGLFKKIEINEGCLLLNIRYSLTCNLNAADIFVLKIYNLPKSTETINQFIEEGLNDFKQIENLANDFYEIKSQLVSYVSYWLLRYGLLVDQLDFYLQGDDDLAHSINLSNPDFKIITSDIQNTIRIGYSAEIKTNNKIKALLHKANPEVLKDEITKIIAYYISAELTLEELLLGYENAIKHSLTLKINESLKENGKEVTYFALSLHPEGNNSLILLESQNNFYIKIEDHPGLLKLKYTCELGIDLQRQAIASMVAIDPEALEIIITNQVKKTILEKVTIIQFYNELNHGMADMIKEDIDPLLMKWGRKLSYIQFESDLEKNRVDDLEITTAVNCITKDGYPITIEHTLLLQRNSTEPKISELSKISDLHQWGNDKLHSISKNFIIQKNYNELLFDFHGNKERKYDAEIKNLMEAEAAKIGYKVNQLVIIPEFMGQILHNARFGFEIEGDDFVSSDSRVPLAVFLRIEGKITDYDKIMNTLAPREVLSDKMQKSVKDSVRTFFHTIAPDRFYMRFHSYDMAENEMQSVESELKEKIRNTLDVDFGIKEVSLYIKQKETKLSKRLSQLQRGTFEVEFQDKTGNIKYKAMVEIQHVAPELWHKFNARDYKPRDEDKEDAERKDISKWLKDYIESKLNDVTEDINIIHSENNYKKSFIDKIKPIIDEAKDEIKTFFGLVIDINQPVKLPTEVESLYRKVLENKLQNIELNSRANTERLYIIQKEKNTRLAELYSKRRELDKLGIAQSAPQRVPINTEIEKLEAELNAPLEFGFMNEIQKFIQLSGGNLSSEENNETKQI
jgi:hypothetical protein